MNADDFSGKLCYAGQWRDSKWNGEGKEWCENGDIFEGKFKNGYRERGIEFKFIRENIYEEYEMQYDKLKETFKNLR